MLENYDGNNEDQNFFSGDVSRPRMATRINIKSLKSMKQQQVSIEEEKQGQKLSVFKFENVDKFNDVDKAKLIEEFKKEQ